MIYDFDIDKIQDALQDLCERHVDVAHNVNGNKSFARYQSGSEIAEIKKSAGKNIVVVGGVAGRRTGHKDDRMFRRELVIRFAVYAEKGDPEEARRQALKRAEAIMLQFMAKIEERQELDLRDDTYGVWHFLKPEEFSWEEIEDAPWLLNHHGFDLTIPFDVFAAQVDAAKWTD